MNTDTDTPNPQRLSEADARGIKRIILENLCIHHRCDLFSESYLAATVRLSMPHVQATDLDALLLDMLRHHLISCVPSDDKRGWLYHVLPDGEQLYKDMRDSFEDAREPHDAELNTPGEPGDFMQRLVALESKVQQLRQDLATLKAH